MIPSMFHSKVKSYNCSKHECIQWNFFDAVTMIITCTLTDHSGIIVSFTADSVNGVSMSAAEQLCLRASTLDTTYSRRLGGVTECTTCYSNSTCVNEAASSKLFTIEGL